MSESVMYSTKRNKPTYRYMKRLSFIICTTIILLGLTACYKEPDKEPDNYYVKYEAQIASIHTGGTAKYVVSTENGSTSITSRSKTWTETFGPVKKGFTASISGETSGYGGTLTLNIYVCRGEEPFVIKAQQVFNSADFSVSGAISYTIDF